LTHDHFHATLSLFRTFESEMMASAQKQFSVGDIVHLVVRHYWDKNIVNNLEAHARQEAFKDILLKTFEKREPDRGAAELVSVASDIASALEFRECIFMCEDYNKYAAERAKWKKGLLSKLDSRLSLKSKPMKKLKDVITKLEVKQKDLKMKVVLCDDDDVKETIQKAMSELNENIADMENQMDEARGEHQWQIDGAMEVVMGIQDVVHAETTMAELTVMLQRVSDFERLIELYVSPYVKCSSTLTKVAMTGMGGVALAQGSTEADVVLKLEGKMKSLDARSDSILPAAYRPEGSEIEVEEIC